MNSLINTYALKRLVSLFKFESLNNPKQSIDREVILNSFPKTVENELNDLLKKLSIHSKHKSQSEYLVVVNENEIKIPGRIYWEVNRLKEPNNLSTVQKDLFSCILTRHHNGYIREKYLRKIIRSEYDWATPYVIQLLGEYLIEILDIIYLEFENINKNNLSNFIINNPKYWNSTKSRIISYWDCYYRKKFVNQKNGFTREEYVGEKIVKLIENLIEETTMPNNL